MLCELFALALTTGYTNFGSLVNGFGGERYKNIGPEGNEDHHEYYHAYGNSEATNAVVRWWIDQYMGRIAKTLSIFNSIQEENGKTLLDNTAIVVGTEHDEQHSNDKMTFFVAGRQDIFKTGQAFSARTRLRISI